jgi:uncharacterized protein with FMN-binding domain
MSAPRSQRPALNPVPPRAVVALVATALGLVLLFSFRTPDQAPPRTADVPPSLAAAPTAPPASPTPAASAQSSAASGTASGPPRPSANGGTTTVTGDDEQNRFGDVQVQVTFAAGRIADVKALKMPFDRARSAYISQTVEPWLRDEALQAQSAQIDLISGATYTSTSYAQSLQSAIDKARG